MEKKEEEKKETITPSQYFDFIKGAKQRITTEELRESYDVFVAMAEKYKKLGQKESLKKLSFLADVLVREEALVKEGINTFVYKDVVEDYIMNVADDAVKIIELSRYMREIPDELVATVEKGRGIFDELYVVFTDYTGREERKVERDRRDKDPILFGVFKNGTSVADRFYFLGDWVDEYCDLTLDKMVAQYSNKKGETPTIEIENAPKTAEELIALMHTYVDEATNGDSVILSNDVQSDLDRLADNVIELKNTFLLTKKEPKKGFFERIRSAFKK